MPLRRPPSPARLRLLKLRLKLRLRRKLKALSALRGPGAPAAASP